jgi:hypothetical protein
MDLKEIMQVVEAELLVDGPSDSVVHYACASDLMSDVLHLVKPRTLLITGLTNPQVVRTADMADIPVILFARGKYPAPDTLALAKQLGIAAALSPYSMFEAAGLLYSAGLRGIGKLPIIYLK